MAQVNEFRGADKEACFRVYDQDGDDKLNLPEFRALCEALFRNETRAYPLPEDRLAHMFRIFDTNGDGFIDRAEFAACWQRWVAVIVDPVSALLVVDVQNDFISGSLALASCPAGQDGAAVIPPINELLETVPFRATFYSLDWHPADHVSFVDNVALRKLRGLDAAAVKVHDTVTFEGTPPVTQHLWPRHCVRGTWGARLHADLKIVEGAIEVHKGTDPEVDSYSAFWDNGRRSHTSLEAALRARGVTDLYVCGLAYDVCVGASAADALAAGFRAVLVEDAARGVSLAGVAAARRRLLAAHGAAVPAAAVRAMVAARDRRPELGYKLALDIEKAAGALAAQ